MKAKEAEDEGERWRERKVRENKRKKEEGERGSIF